MVVHLLSRLRLSSCRVSEASGGFSLESVRPAPLSSPCCAVRLQAAGFI